MFQVKSDGVPAEQIEGQLGRIQTGLARPEEEGVELERSLRSGEEGADLLLPVLSRGKSPSDNGLRLRERPWHARLGRSLVCAKCYNRQQLMTRRQVSAAASPASRRPGCFAAGQHRRAPVKSRPSPLSLSLYNCAVGI